MFEGFLIIVSIINSLLLLWNLLVLNAGFESIQSIIEANNKRVELLVKKCDEIVLKYKMMVKSIDESK